MNDPVERALAALGLDTPNPHIAARLWGRIAAEPTVLEAWCQDSHHPGLAPAYRALYERVRPRVAACVVRARADPEFPDQTFDAARADAVADGQATTHELTRLTWLLALRRERAEAAAALGDAWPVDEDEEEANALEALLTAHRRGLC